MFASKDAQDGSEPVERTSEVPEVELNVPASKVHDHAVSTRATGGRCACRGYTRFGGEGAASAREVKAAPSASQTENRRVVEVILIFGKLSLQRARTESIRSRQRLCGPLRPIPTRKTRTFTPVDDVLSYYFFPQNLHATLFPRIDLRFRDACSSA